MFNEPAADDSNAADAADANAAAVSSSTDKKTPKGKSSSKILLKPQSKHLRTRIDYLIKVLQNQINTEQYGADWKKTKDGTATTTPSASKKSSSSRKKPAEVDNDDANGHADVPKSSSRKK